MATGTSITINPFTADTTLYVSVVGPGNCLFDSRKPVSALCLLNPQSPRFIDAGGGRGSSEQIKRLTTQEIKHIYLQRFEPRSIHLLPESRSPSPPSRLLSQKASRRGARIRSPETPLLPEIPRGVPPLPMTSAGLRNPAFRLSRGADGTRLPDLAPRGRLAGRSVMGVGKEMRDDMGWSLPRRAGSVPPTLSFVSTQ